MYVQKKNKTAPQQNPENKRFTLAPRPLKSISLIPLFLALLCTTVAKTPPGRYSPLAPWKHVRFFFFFFFFFANLFVLVGFACERLCASVHVWYVRVAAQSVGYVDGMWILLRAAVCELCYVATGTWLYFGFLLSSIAVVVTQPPPSLYSVDLSRPG